MADSVFKLVVDSKEYDSKIQRATSGLMAFEKKCREVAGTLEFVEKEDLDFVKALGQMETVSQSASGKIAELKKAFIELSVQYKNLTYAEKQAPYGKALAASLDLLRGRIKSAEGDLRSVQADLSGFGVAFKELGAKVGIPSQMFSTLGISVAAAGAAIKVGSDALKRNDEMLDDWNATVQASKSIYDSFLVSLNTGDFSGFIRGMGSVARAAMEAYAALDKLDTFNAFNQINLQRAQTQFTEAVASYREGTGTKSEVRAAAEEWKNQLEARRKLEQEAYLAKIREIAASRGVDADLLTQALSGNYGDYETLKATQMPTKSVYNSSTRSFNDVIDYDAATEVQKLGQALRQLNDTQLQEIQALGRQAQATATEIAQVDRQTVRMLGKSSGGDGNTAATGGVTTKDLNPLQESQRKISELSVEALTADEERKEVIRQEIEGLQAQVAAYKQIQDYVQGINKDAEPQEIETTMSGPSMSAFEKLQQSIRIQQADAAAILDENTLKTLLGVAIQNGINGLDLDFSRIMDEMQEGLDISPEAWRELEAKINEQLAALNLDPIKLNVETGGLIAADKQVKSTTQAWQAAASAVSTVGSALQQIEDPAAKIAGIVAAAVAQVALTFAMSLKGTVTPWDWIAAALAGTTTMISTITAIKSVTSAKGYAGGGMVEGTSYSGDNIVARLNAGEGVLTSQGVQNAEMMASIVEGGQQGGGASSSFVTGENIVLGVNNFLGRSGHGEIVTTSMLRRAGIKL